MEVVAQKVTDLTSLGKLVYDVATDKQTRADIANQFQNIKDQIGDNPKEFFPILGEVILTIGTGNSSEEWDKSVNSKDNGEKSHFATRGVVNTVFTAATIFSSVKELPKFSQKLGEEIKKVKVKKIFNSAQEFAEDIIKNRSTIRNVLDSKIGKEYAKKYFEKMVKKGDFETWYNNIFKKYNLGEPLNFEVHHIIPISVLKENKALQELLLWAEKNGKKFDFNGLDNAIPLQKKRLKYEISGHANHPDYDKAIIDKIKNITNSKILKNEEKLDAIQNIIDKTKIKLEKEVLLGNKDVNDIINF